MTVRGRKPSKQKPKEITFRTAKLTDEDYSYLVKRAEVEQISMEAMLIEAIKQFTLDYKPPVVRKLSMGQQKVYPFKKIILPFDLVFYEKMNDYLGFRRPFQLVKEIKGHEVHFINRRNTLHITVSSEEIIIQYATAAQKINADNIVKRYEHEVYKGQTNNGIL